MPTPTKGPRLGGSPTHERHMLNNLSAQLFQHKRITTTLTKAKRLRPDVYKRQPVQYAKRMIGRRTIGGTNTYIPLKVNMAGVIPLIFASSLLTLPGLIAQFNTPTNGSTPPDWVNWINAYLVRGDHPLYIALYFFMIIGFAYFYVAVTFDPVEVADNMKKYGGFIPGIRAGKPTERYLSYVLNRITLPGALYLGVISMIPLVALILFNANQNFPFGGASLLIVVGVGLDTLKPVSYTHLDVYKRQH